MDFRRLMQSFLGGFMGRSPANQIKSIVRILEKKGMAACPMEESLHLARTSPEAIKELAVSVMQHFPQGGTFLDATLGYLPETDWQQIVQPALDALEVTHGENEAAESVIAYASLQSLSALHPHLDRIFELAVNASTYNSGYPWRESGGQHFDHLRKMIEKEKVSERKGVTERKGVSRKKRCQEPNIANKSPSVA